MGKTIVRGREEQDEFERRNYSTNKMKIVEEIETQYGDGDLEKYGWKQDHIFLFNRAKTRNRQVW